MRAVTSGDPKFRDDLQRCGADCSATSTRGAMVYFPPGEYLISKPIVQYYYTAFAGHPVNRAKIRGSKDFKGIALIDTDVYIPMAKGAEWCAPPFLSSSRPLSSNLDSRWTHQNNFYRQIRNLVFDLSDMPNGDLGGDPPYLPTGIHW